MKIETFPAFQIAGLRHGFSTRIDVPLDRLDAEINDAFEAAGLPMEDAVHAEQPHGNRTQAVYTPLGIRVPDVDAMATSVPRLPLVVRVADCGPLFFYDPTQKVIAVAHSGRKGTAGNILAATLECLRDTYDTHPENVIVQLGPCIRPPHYEIDFATEIGSQAKAAGIRHFHDCGICTASHLERYYSYRVEKGKTGRMWGVLMIE